MVQRIFRLRLRGSSRWYLVTDTDQNLSGFDGWLSAEQACLVPVERTLSSNVIGIQSKTRLSSIALLIP